MGHERAGLGVVQIPAGSFLMGDAFAEGYAGDGEEPVHEVQLSRFLISSTAVTNEQFAAFVDTTGYRTSAEELGLSAVFHLAYTGDRTDIVHELSLVPWWLAVRGAQWRHPEGINSDLTGRGAHPVVHISWLDAQAYCHWAGMRLPTEAEWEYAARGGLNSARFSWGDDVVDMTGRWQCNIWQGDFPWRNTLDDGYLTTAPVRSYRPNGYGLWQTNGNVWEWCADWFAADYYQQAPMDNPAGPDTGESRVIRGGSYLCHDSYCMRYRVAARSHNTPDSASANIGFRCVVLQ